MSFVHAHAGMRWLGLDGIGFFSRDGLLALWLALLVDDVEAGSSEPWERGLAAEWRSQVTVCFDGVMTSELDAHLRDPTRCRRLRGEVERRVAEPGPLTRRIEGNRWGRPATWAGLGRVADAMLWLLDTPAPTLSARALEELRPALTSAPSRS